MKDKSDSAYPVYSFKYLKIGGALCYTVVHKEVLIKKKEVEGCINFLADKIGIYDDTVFLRYDCAHCRKVYVCSL